MLSTRRPGIRAFLIWAALITAIAVPTAIAAMSPLLAWRQPVYIAAGLAGVVAMALLLVQPLLVGGYLPGLAGLRGRRAHALVGGGLVAAIVVHVGGLWLTSPPDVVDALLFRSPTPFSAWGVVAMWAAFLAALLAASRRRLRLRWRTWRRTHGTLAMIVVAGSVVHAVLIDGTMGATSKAILSVLVVGATIVMVANKRVFTARGGPTP